MSFGLGLAALCLAGLGCGGASSSSGTFTPHTQDVLTVATDAIPSPGFWEGTAAHPTGGLEYALAQELARRFDLSSVRVTIVPFPRLVAGDLGGADLGLALISPTSEREESLDFSAPYLDAAPTIVVRAGTPVPDLQAAQGLRWGVERATTFVELVEDEIRPADQPTVYETQAELIAALMEGRIKAALFDLPSAVAIADRSRGRLEVAAKLRRPEQIAAALPKGSSNDQAVDSAMRALVANGTVSDLLDRWVGEDAADAERDVPLLRTAG